MKKKSPISFLSLLILLLIIGVVFVLHMNQQKIDTPVSQAAVMKGDGHQEINVAVKNGYSPSYINAKSNSPTLLRLSTKNTLDCSAALKIPALGVDKTLPSTGITEIIIPPQKSGSEIIASCSMGGMHSLRIKFS